MAVNKVIFGSETLIDLTGDTVDKEHLLKGVTAHDKSGAVISGECTFDSDTSEDTVAQAEILEGKTAHARGALLTGTMPNRGKVTGTISTRDGAYTIQQGYHDGSGTVSLNPTDKNKIIPTNIREGVTILGVVGTMSGSEGEKKQVNKDVVPSKVEQVITPDPDYTCLVQVTVKPIPYVLSDNAAGGKTAIIA